MSTFSSGFGRLVPAAGPDPLYGLLADRAESEAARRRRNPPLPPGPTAPVLVLGAGRMGTWVSNILAPMGVSLVVLDRDVVEPHNLEAGSAPFGLADVGLPKALAVANSLKQFAPRAHVQAYQGDIVLMPVPELFALSQGVGVVLGLVDAGEALLRINEVFYRHLPIVYAAGHHGARTGDILIGRPGGACFRCLLGIDTADSVQTLSGETTHGIDILKLSEYCARVTLALLRDQRLGQISEVLDEGVNFIFLQNRVSPGNLGNFAPQFLRIDRRWDCPVCGAR